MTNSVFLSGPFRPFFLLTAFMAVAIPTFWISYFTGNSDLQTWFSTNLVWHAHEMIFGFTSSLLAGFLLTASAVWAKKKAYTGVKLFTLVGLWFLERIFYLTQVHVGIAFGTSILFSLLFLFFMVQMLLGSEKNFKTVIPLLLLFFIYKFFLLIGDFTAQETLYKMGVHGGLFTIILFIVIFSARLIPFFTRVRLNIEVTVPKWIKFTSVISHFLLVFMVRGEVPNILLAIVLTLALTANLLTLIYLKPSLVFKEPMLAILHSGLFWVNVGLLLYLLALFYPDLAYTQLPLHALASGALGAFAIGMMIRVTRGHTTLPMKADKWDQAAFWCVNIGAAIRVFTPLILPNVYLESLHYSSGFWTLGFLIYLVKYTRVLFKK